MATPVNIGNVTSRAYATTAGSNSNSPLYFEIRAVNTAGESEWSNAVPNIYLDLPTLTIGTPAGATLPLTWTNLKVGEDISYELQYATDAGFTTGTGSATIAADTTSYNFTMTTPGTTYYFKLRGKWTSSGPPSTDAYGMYSATVSHLYPASGFNIDVRDTEANILTRTGDATGVIAYGTDTEDLYVYDGTNWQIYNNDGYFNIDVRDTKANILSRTGDAVGVIAFVTTGANQDDLLVYDGTNWQIYNNS